MGTASPLEEEIRLQCKTDPGIACPGETERGMGRHCQPECRRELAEEDLQVRSGEFPA
jgi:hypothetical protein